MILSSLFWHSHLLIFKDFFSQENQALTLALFHALKRREFESNKKYPIEILAILYHKISTFYVTSCPF